jgi:hypothetical protein
MRMVTDRVDELDKCKISGSNYPKDAIRPDR